MKLIHIPLELLEERYSKQWFNWFEDEFSKQGVCYTSVLPRSGLNAKIEIGEFLDVIKTNQFKAEQLQCITKLFKNNVIDHNTVFLFMDSWFPGLEMLAYMRNALGIPFKIAGIFHAGTWDQHDFITKCGMKPWGQFCERAWFEILDVIFVATQFHKNLIIENSTHVTKDYLHLTDKIKVTGLPIYPDFVNSVQKEKIVVFPHRIADEKRPQDFKEMRNALSSAYPDWQFVFTKEVCKNKKEYYELLNKSAIAVSYAEQETFGIAQIEATLCGCVPVVPNQLAYKELYYPIFQYDRTKDCHQVDVMDKVIDLIEIFNTPIENTYPFCTLANEHLVMALQYQQKYFIKLGKNAIPSMIQHCEELL